MSLTQEEMGDLVGPLSISIATRDAELKPHFARAFGVRMSEDQKFMTVMIPKVIFESCLKDINDNKLIAVTVAHMANFKTRQYKGIVQEIKDCTEEDYELMKTVREAGAENSALFSVLKREKVGINISFVPRLRLSLNYQNFSINHPELKQEKN